MLFLVACSSTDGELKLAEQLIETSPDSAFQILQKIKSGRYMNKSDHALYALLMSQALDKKDIKVKSDSLIRFATNFYNENDPIHAGYAYFYLARSENNQGNIPKQAQALLKAQEFASKGKDSKLLGLIYGDKADMYRTQGQTDSMILYDKYSFSIFQEMKDIRNSVLAAICIGHGFRKNSNYDSAMKYYHLAEKIAIPLHDTLLTSTIYKSLGGISYKQKQYDDALFYFQSAPLTNIEIYDYNKWYLIGKVFLKKGELDSARIYLKRVKIPENLAVDYYKTWQELSEKEGRLSEALYYAKRVIIVKDSLQQHSLASSFAGLEKKYHYEHLTVENKNLIIRNKQNGIVILMSLLTLSILYIIFMIWRSRVKKRQLIIQGKLIKQEKALVEKEKENNTLMQQQVKMQHILLKNVEQYRKQAIKRPESIEEKSIVGQTNTFYEELINYMDAMHQNISKRLAEKYPQLTYRDILICCMLLANFDTGMIATILEVQSDSINVHRTRLRKKLQIQNQDNLLHFLRTF